MLCRVLTDPAEGHAAAWTLPTRLPCLICTVSILGVHLVTTSTYYWLQISRTQHSDFQKPKMLGLVVHNGKDHPKATDFLVLKVRCHIILIIVPWLYWFWGGFASFVSALKSFVSHCTCASWLSTRFQVENLIDCSSAWILKPFLK